MIIDLTEYLERRRQTAKARVVQLATASRYGKRVARSGAGRIEARLGSAGRWSTYFPRVPALELGAIYADASLI